MVEKKEKLESKILFISFISGALMALAEFVFSFLYHSQSVLFDAVYDTIEILIVGLTVFLTPLFYKPVTERHPFGYAQVESVVVMFKTLMLVAATFVLMANAVQTILLGGHIVSNDTIAVFEVILGVISLIVYFILRHLNQSLMSPMVSSEVESWRVDTNYSIGLAAAFLITSFMKGTRLEPYYVYVDSILVIVLSIYSLPELITLMIRETKNTFLFSPEEEMVTDIRKRCSRVLAAFPAFKTTFYDITRTGRQIWVRIYFEPTTETISSNDLNTATSLLNETLAAHYENCHCELSFDISPD